MTKDNVMKWFLIWGKNQNTIIPPEILYQAFKQRLAYEASINVLPEVEK